MVSRWIPVTDSVRIELDVPLSTNPVTKNAAIVWPTALDARLDHLLSLVAQRHRTDRRELVAALVFAAEPNAEELGRLLDAYRAALTRDALGHVEDATPHTSVIELRKHKPGPRPKLAG